MWMLMTMVWSLWSLSALRWAKALSLSGPRITKLSQTPLVWLLSLKTASKYHSCVQFLLQHLVVVTGLCAKHFHQSAPPPPRVLISRSRAIFNTPSLDDLGTYSCMVTGTDGFSSSYTLTEEGESDCSLSFSETWFTCYLSGWCQC